MFYDFFNNRALKRETYPSLNLLVKSRQNLGPDQNLQGNLYQKKNVSSHEVLIVKAFRDIRNSLSDTYQLQALIFLSFPPPVTQDCLKKTIIDGLISDLHTEGHMGGYFNVLMNKHVDLWSSDTVMSKQLAKETQNLLYLEHTAKHCSSGVNVSFNLILLNQSLPAGSISETCKHRRCIFASQY